MTSSFSGRHSGPPKLDDCLVHGPGSGAELIVVEGDSAAAAVTRVRDPRLQAVLPMQGKPLNAVRASRSRVLGHPFFGPLAMAVGAGIEADCEPARSRYDRLLVLTDPDADGIHCGFLVLLFFHRWLRPLLDDGRIELERPPWCGFLRRIVGGFMSVSSARRAARGEWGPEHPNSGFASGRQHRIGTRS